MKTRRRMTFAARGIHLLAACSVCVLLATAATAQEWGEITDEEWNLEPPEAYPRAGAAIIFDQGSLDFDSRRDDFERHTRLKVFSKAGAGDALDIEIIHAKHENFRNLEAQTILPDGRIVKVDKKHIFHKKVGPIIVTTFAFLAVEDGAIIEYKYCLENSRIIVTDPWYFQNALYTFSSRFTFSHSSNMNFDTEMKNVAADKLVQAPAESEKSSKKTWEMRDIPPLRAEPMCGEITNYMPHVFFRLTDYEFWFMKLKFRRPTWGKVGKSMTEMVDDYIASQETVDSLAARLAHGAEDRERIIRLYCWVRDSIETRNPDLGRYLYFKQENSDSLLQKRFGSAAEKNVLLVALLRALDIDARPLAIGTRGYSSFSRALPELRQFNHLLCYIDDYPYACVLDTRDRDIPYPYLPTDDLIDGGLILAGEDSETVRLAHRTRSNTLTQATSIRVGLDCSAICSTSVSASGYCLSEWLDFAADPMSPENTNELLFPGRDVAFKTIAATAYYDTLADTLHAEIVVYVPELGGRTSDALLINPFVFQCEHNPFATEERIFPVDFGYSSKYTHKIRLKAPEGWTIAQTPDDMDESIDGVNFSRLVMKWDDRVDISLRHTVTDPFFPPARYPELRALYETNAASNSDQIVLVSETD